MTSNDDFTSTDPHDVIAEQAVLGAMMLSPAVAAECLQALTAADFYRGAHHHVFTAIAAIVRDGATADAITVKARLEAEGNLRVAGEAPYLHTLIASVPTVTIATSYAQIVRGYAIRRRLLEAGRRITQMAREDGSDAHGLTERAVREVETVRDSGLGDDVTTPDAGEFLDVPDDADSYDWVIPGLLERGDRMVITGTEGLGKTQLLLQIGVTAAAGIDPFTHKPGIPRRVLYIDCENGASYVRRRLRPLALAAAQSGYPVPRAGMFIEVRPEGMDLALERDVSRLLRMTALLNPDLVILGPLYRLAPRALNSDDEAAPIISALNMLRARGACVLLEAHAGHGLGMGGVRDLRPRGSSAFLGWPEFGYGLRPAQHPDAKRRRLVDVVPWRGDRDQRDWPEMLAGGGVWPWSAYVAGYGDAGESWTPHGVADR